MLTRSDVSSCSISDRDVVAAPARWHVDDRSPFREVRGHRRASRPPEQFSRELTDHRADILRGLACVARAGGVVRPSGHQGAQPLEVIREDEFRAAPGGSDRAGSHAGDDRVGPWIRAPPRLRVVDLDALPAPPARSISMPELWAECQRHRCSEAGAGGTNGCPKSGMLESRLRISPLTSSKQSPSIEPVGTRPFMSLWPATGRRNRRWPTRARSRARGACRSWLDACHRLIVA
jgi:hypothetical protein